ncbi:MAG: ferredoxin [Tepidisphaerales bacterium]
MSDTTITSNPVTHVGIIEGCIICGLCEDTCPQVFCVRDESAVIRQSAEKFYESQAEQIVQAAVECPVAVIKVRRVKE